MVCEVLKNNVLKVHILWNVKEYAKMFFSELQIQISQNVLEIPKKKIVILKKE